MGKLSVVLPAYNEEEMIEKACAAIREILEKEKIPYELIFVDDGSSDNTWQEIKNAGKENEKIVGVRFSRNFGKEAAVYAGLSKATGEVVAVMDCDLQHPPEVLPEMYALWKQGYEVIEGVKKSRGKESFFHKKGAELFYRLMSDASKVNMQNASDFKMLDRKAVDGILSMPERNLFFRATSSWVGFRTTYVEFEVKEREAGVSKWSTRSLLHYAFINIVSFTTAPLQFVTITGAACFGCSLILLVYTLIQFFRRRAVEGYTTILIALLLIGSAVMVSLGIIGFYLARIYEEVKHRPRYLISELVFGAEDSASKEASETAKKTDNKGGEEWMTNEKESAKL